MRASCVAKVTTALERVPGLADVEVNLMAERLSSPPPPQRPPPRRSVRSKRWAMPSRPWMAMLAHGLLAAHADHDHDDPADAEKPWWNTGKARLVWLLGGLVGAHTRRRCCSRRA